MGTFPFRKKLGLNPGRVFCHSKTGLPAIDFHCLEAAQSDFREARRRDFGGIYFDRGGPSVVVQFPSSGTFR